MKEAATVATRAMGENEGGGGGGWWRLWVRNKKTCVFALGVFVPEREERGEILVSSKTTSFCLIFVTGDSCHKKFVTNTYLFATRVFATADLQ